MTAAVLPGWAAVPVALLVLTGAGLTLIGSLGLLRLGSFYERVHAPTLGTTMGMACMLLASMLLFSVLQTRAVTHELLIGLFTVVTTPISLILLAGAARHRDRLAGKAAVPASPAPPDADPHRPPGSGRHRR